MSRISTIGEHIVIDLDKQTINYDGNEIYSFTTDKLLFSLLEYFCLNSNITLSKEKLYTSVHDDDDYYADTSIKNLIYRLRHIVSKEEYPEFADSIQTKSDGYMYTGSSIRESKATTSEDDNGEAHFQEAPQGNKAETEKEKLNSDTRTDHDVIADNVRKTVSIFAEAFKVCEHGLAEEIRSKSDSNDDNPMSKSTDNTSIQGEASSSGSVGHQTIVNQYGDHPVHIDHVDNLNL